MPNIRKSHETQSENKVTAKYMAQVQLQMHFSNKPRALFCVIHSHFQTTKKVSIIQVDYYRQLCDLLEKCNIFWNNAIFPKLYTKFDWNVIYFIVRGTSLILIWFDFLLILFSMSFNKTNVNIYSFFY